MHPVGADALGQVGVGGHEQDQPALPAQARQAPRHIVSIPRPKVPVNQGRPSWHAPSGGLRVGQADRIGEQIERGERWQAGLAVEAGGDRR